jgi:hypothetical protein
MALHCRRRLPSGWYRGVGAAAPNESTMTKSNSFDPTMEFEWHRMISEDAYFLAENRALEDWVQAELKV